MSTFAERMLSCAVILLLTLGVGCEERAVEAVPWARMAIRANEAECALEGIRASELAYVGAARATYGEPVTVAARLTDAASQPLVGRSMTRRAGAWRPRMPRAARRAQRTTPWAAS